MQKAWKHIVLSFLAAAVLPGCSLVDENLSDCETDYRIDYQLRLVTNMTTELQTQLGLQTDIALATALKTYLSDIFTDYAHDVDLSFYDVGEEAVRLHHEQHIMNDNASSYTLYIPVRRYMHLGVANLEGCENVSLEDDNLCNRSHLHQQVADTLSSHRKGIFTARLPMDVKEGVDQHFDVRLYMVNCASALVLDTLGSHIKDIKVYTAGFATDFDIADSTYRYQYTPVFRTDKLDLSDVTSSKLCFVSVTFPSKTATDTDADTKIVIDTDDPFVTDDADQTLWQFRVYATLRDNTVTETLLSLKKPVLPGQLRCLTASVYENGTVSPADPTVGVSVTLDWDPGLEVDVEI